MTPVVLVYDEGTQVGLGHRRRMEALGSALERRGTTVTVQPAAGRIDADVVVVDSYRRRADDESFVTARVVAAVDDLERDLCVELLIDPNSADASAPRARRLLAGPAYALIDPGYSAEPAGPRAHVSTILITAGGAGSAVAADISRALADLTPRTTRLRVVVGPAETASLPTSASAVWAPQGLRDELIAADIVVTAGGVTMLEAMASGRPVVAFVTADNQRRAVGSAAGCGAVLAAPSPQVAAEMAAALVDDGRTRARLAAAGRAHVDGRGADRVAAELHELC